MKTICLSPRFNSDSQDIWRAANFSKEFETHRSINFEPPENKNCCVFGELTFCDIMADRCGLALLDPHDKFLELIGEEFTKRDIKCCKVRNLYRGPDPFKDGKKFIKPANDKVFQRGVYHKVQDVPINYVDDSCPIIISEVVDFQCEYRLYCGNGKVITSSSYIYIGDGDEEADNQEAIDFGEQVLANSSCLLPSVVVLDVGKISDRGWAVIEANQLYASGIYQYANVNALLPLIYASSGLKEKVKISDRKFIRNI